jgi:hypothetical protein
MRLVLISYFDVSESYGLGDDCFSRERLAADYDAMGRGVRVDLPRDHSGLVNAWRQLAVEQVDRPEMELGFDPILGLTRSQFSELLKTVIRECRMTRCDITVLAVGLALLRLDFDAGIPVDLVRGVGRCFEYAAYTPRISNGLHEAAQQTAEGAVPDFTHNRLAKLTRRGPRNGSIHSEGVTGDEESPLLTGTGFTNVLVFMDAGDDEVLESITRAFELGDPTPDEVVEFEFHGSLRFDWATCLVRARRLEEWTGEARPGQEAPEQAVGRMLACIEVAHSFLGACDAFRELFRAEIRAQVDGYAKAVRGGRESQDLNRLRTLALALISLTSFNLVTASAEDQRYFRLFEQAADIEQRKTFIQEACEILYNVEEAEGIMRNPP